MSSKDAVDKFMAANGMPKPKPKHVPKHKKVKRKPKYFVRAGDMGYNDKGKPIPFSKKKLAELGSK